MGGASLPSRKYFTAMRILYLPLKKEWYNEIESGRKTEEYRAIKPYWIRRFCENVEDHERCRYCGLVGIAHSCFKPTKKYTHVCFRYGYTKKTMTFKIESISIGKGKPEMGAPNHDVFIIKFSKES